MFGEEYFSLARVFAEVEPPPLNPQAPGGNGTLLPARLNEVLCASVTSTPRAVTASKGRARPQRPLRPPRRPRKRRRQRGDPNTGSLNSAGHPSSIPTPQTPRQAPNPAGASFLVIPFNASCSGTLWVGDLAPKNGGSGNPDFSRAKAVWVVRVKYRQPLTSLVFARIPQSAPARRCEARRAGTCHNAVC